jgi:hypothetical protein
MGIGFVLQELGICGVFPFIKDKERINERRSESYINR